VRGAASDSTLAERPNATGASRSTRPVSAALRQAAGSLSRSSRGL
jgi:hypothetical protein